MERQRADRAGLATARLVLVLAVLTGVLFAPGLTEELAGVSRVPGPPENSSDGDSETGEEDCFWVRLSKDGPETMYRGRHSSTLGGHACLPWTDHYLHLFSAWPAPQGETIKDAENFCRDPTGQGAPWCLIDNVTGDVCDIPYCTATTVSGEADSSLLHCYLQPTRQNVSALYWGLTNTPGQGLDCLPWSRVSDSLARSFLLRGQGVLDPRSQGNFCRDMDGSGVPWCLVRWEGLNGWSRRECWVPPCAWNFTAPPNLSHAPALDSKQWRRDMRASLADVLWREEDCFWLQRKSLSQHAVYRGSRDFTASGHACVAWAQFEAFNYSLLFSSILGEDVHEAKNYCRDPSVYSIPWCLTSRTEFINEICDVPYCTEQSEDARRRSLRFCFKTPDSALLSPQRALYLGMEARTASGKPCQPWHQVKVEALRGQMQLFQGLRDPRLHGNFCRDMLGKGFPWCFTDVIKGEWEQCDVPECSDDITEGDFATRLPLAGHRKWQESMRAAALEELWKDVDCFWLEQGKERLQAVYTGRHNYSASGRECTPWVFATHNFTLPHGESPASASNYCRDPESIGVPTCYVEGNILEMCDIPHCTSTSERALLESLQHCFLQNGFESVLYQGLQNMSALGENCHPWFAFEKLGGQNMQMAVRESLLLMDVNRLGNLCRDVTGFGFPGCFTGTAVLWHRCAVPRCRAFTSPTHRLAPPRPDHTQWLRQKTAMVDKVIWSAVDCFWVEQTPRGAQAMYKGSRNTTASGYTCQEWASFRQYNYTADFLDALNEDVTEAKNFCRDPNFFGLPWCHTVEVEGKTDVCDIPYCASGLSLHRCFLVSKSVHFTRALYLGLTSTTLSNKKCRPWSQIQDPTRQFWMYYYQGHLDPSHHGNFCRDMLGRGYVWCYTDVERHLTETCGVSACPNNWLGSPELYNIRLNSSLEWKLSRKWMESRDAALRELQRAEAESTGRPVLQQQQEGRSRGAWLPRQAWFVLVLLPLATSIIAAATRCSE